MNAPRWHNLVFYFVVRQSKEIRGWPVIEWEQTEELSGDLLCCLTGNDV